MAERAIIASCVRAIKPLNQQVRRNRNRFPADFLFELTAKEFANLKMQFASSSWGGRRTLPFAFTERDGYYQSRNAAPLRPQVFVEESLDRRVSMPAIVLPRESMLGAGVHHGVEWFTQVLQPAK